MRKSLRPSITWGLLAALLGVLPAHAAEIVVGQVAPMSGLDANQGRAYAAGMQLLFDSVNNAGGVNGHTLSLTRKDDGGRPEDTVAATRGLLAEEKPIVLAGFFGNRNITDLVASKLLEKNGVALVGYRITEVRPETPLLYSVRANLKDELNKLCEHLATIGITRLGLFYEEGPGSPLLLAAAGEAAAKARATIVSKTSYPVGTSSVAPAVDVFVKAAPQVVILVTSGATASAFIEQYRQAGGTAQLFAHSGVDIEQMSKRLSEEQMQGVAIAQVTPSPYKISGRLSKEFSDAVAKAKALTVPASYAMMEGYITAKVIIEAIRLQGRRPTREGTVAALDTMGNYDLGGYTVGFKPGMRTGSRFVELSIISSSGKIRQ